MGYDLYVMIQALSNGQWIDIHHYHHSLTYSSKESHYLPNKYQSSKTIVNSYICNKTGCSNCYVLYLDDLLNDREEMKINLVNCYDIKNELSEIINDDNFDVDKVKQIQNIVDNFLSDLVETSQYNTSQYVELNHLVNECLAMEKTHKYDNVRVVYGFCW